jgi:SCP-2 sterol transfer family
VAGKQAFLSDEWFAAVGGAIAEHGGAAASPPGPNVLMNLVITGSPFGDREFHMGSKDGTALFGASHLDGADVTLTTDYATARDVFVSGNQAAGMQAFMAGKVKVQGDMTKLMASQGGAGANNELQAAIQELTE